LEIDILLGVVCLGLGNHGEALMYIEKAARQAAPEGSIRPFIDTDTFELVSELHGRMQAGSDSQLITFLEQILALFRQESGTEHRSISKKQLTAHTDLAETISPRELEVLELMAKGLSNVEIARRLYLTVNTLKAHTNSIYGKLDVHSRMQAVIRARELGLLLPGED
jgi:LuxR family maltose regulon positive regulatory protein